MRKKILSLALALIMMLTLATPAFAGGSTTVDKFTDVNSSHWFYDSVKFVTEKGMVNGTSATTFGPLVTMTRSQFITILGRMDGVVDENAYPASGFADVPSNEYYTTHVNWAKESGILDITGGSFRPLADITREEMAIIVGKYIEYKAVPIPDDPNAPVKYNDASTISSAAQPYTELLRKTGVLVGDNFGNMNPKNIMSRSEGVTVFMRIYQKLEAAGVVLTDGLDWFKTAQSEFTISVDDKDVGMYDFLSQAARDKITASGYYLSLSSISDRSILNTKNNLFVPLKAGTVTVTYGSHMQSGSDLRAYEMLTYEFSHTRPNGEGARTAFEDLVDNIGNMVECGSQIVVLSLDANIHTPESTAQRVVQNLLNSSAHNRVIMTRCNNTVLASCGIALDESNERMYVSFNGYYAD
jgi:S-layer homology domain.